jgi:hypothetical protein
MYEIKRYIDNETSPHEFKTSLIQTSKLNSELAKTVELNSITARAVHFNYAHEFLPNYEDMYPDIDDESLYVTAVDKLPT